MSLTAPAPASAGSASRQRSPDTPLRTFALHAYMMRVPLLALAVMGVGLPLGFTSSMMRALADLTVWQIFPVSLLASLLVSAAMTASFLILLYGQERVDGWRDRPSPEDRVQKWPVIALYVAGIAAWASLLFFVRFRMARSGPHSSWDLNLGFLLYALLGVAAGFAIVLLFFFAALRFAKPNNDAALESFAFPAIYVLPRNSPVRHWLRRWKKGTCADAAPGSYASHRDPISLLLAKLGPGYGIDPSSGQPSSLHSGHRFVAIVSLLLLVVYWFMGRTMLHRLTDIRTPWPPGGAPNSILGYVLILILFWTCLLTGITFFFDRFRVPALAGLAVVLYAFSWFGSSDHVFSTVELRKNPAGLLTPRAVVQNKARDSHESITIVAAAGGGIQSAAWTAQALCALRAHSAQNFASSVAAISGVSGGSVGSMFYLRCLEAAAADDSPGLRAQDSSLEAVAWGITHPDLRRIFLPGLSGLWANVDRGWALEHSLLKSAQFQNAERRVAELAPNWPAVLLNSTSGESGDPIVFTNTRFPSQPCRQSAFHYVRGFHQETARDVFLETAARMSAAFPYVSPLARPDQGANIPHLADGGYFDNSGLFALSEWLKEAVFEEQVVCSPDSSEHREQTLDPPAGLKQILIVQLDAFPDGPPQQKNAAKKWYYQLTAPIQTILKVRSESQLVRDDSSGQDLQARLNGAGYPTEWLLMRYDPAAFAQRFPERVPKMPGGNFACNDSPPLSWHLTAYEKQCLNAAWQAIQPVATSAVDEFLSRTQSYPPQGCRDEKRKDAPGLSIRLCAPAPGAAAEAVKAAAARRTTRIPDE